MANGFFFFFNSSLNHVFISCLYWYLALPWSAAFLAALMSLVDHFLHALEAGGSVGILLLTIVLFWPLFNFFMHKKIHTLGSLKANTISCLFSLPSNTYSSFVQSYWRLWHALTVFLTNLLFWIKKTLSISGSLDFNDLYHIYILYPKTCPYQKLLPSTQISHFLITILSVCYSHTSPSVSL